MTPQETLKRLQAWIRSVGVPDCETVEPPSEAEADAAIRAVLEENERLRAALKRAEKNARCYARETNDPDIDGPVPVEETAQWKLEKAEARIEAALAPQKPWTDEERQAAIDALPEYEKAELAELYLAAERSVKDMVKALRGEEADHD